MYHAVMKFIQTYARFPNLILIMKGNFLIPKNPSKSLSPSFTAQSSDRGSRHAESLSNIESMASSSSIAM